MTAPGAVVNVDEQPTLTRLEISFRENPISYEKACMLSQAAAKHDWLPVGAGLIFNMWKVADLTFVAPGWAVAL